MCVLLFSFPNAFLRVSLRGRASLLARCSTVASCLSTCFLHFFCSYLCVFINCCHTLTHTHAHIGTYAITCCYFTCRSARVTAAVADAADCWRCRHCRCRRSRVKKFVLKFKFILNSSRIFNCTLVALSSPSESSLKRAIVSPQKSKNKTI